MSKSVSLLSIFLVALFSSELTLANLLRPMEVSKFSKVFGSAGFEEGIKPKLIEEKSTAIFFVPQSNFTVTSSTSCDDLIEEWYEKSGVNLVESTAKPNQLFFTFFMNCKELMTSEKLVTAAGFFISYDEEGDKILNNEYAKSSHEFYGKKIKFLKPQQSMAYLNIEHDGNGMDEVEHWILMNVPPREYGNLVNKLITMLDVGGAAERKETMTKFLSSELPDLDIQELGQQLKPGFTRVEYTIYPIFQAEGEIFNYYFVGYGDRFKCRESCY